MIRIIDFLINIEYIHFIISMVQLFKEEPLISITFLFFILINIGIFILVTFSIIKIIYYLILKKKIKCMDIIESLMRSSILMSLGIIILITIFIFIVIKNEEVEIIEPNWNKYKIKEWKEQKFKNFPRRTYISLTKEYTLKKIGLDKYIDIKKTLNFDNYELNEVIEKVDTIINIDNNFNLSLDEKKYFKDKVISSKDYNEIGDIRKEIYKLIEEKDKIESIRKEKINLEKQKEILKNLNK